MLLTPSPGLRDIINVFREEQLLSGPSQYVEEEHERRFILEEFLCKSPSLFFFYQQSSKDVTDLL